MTMIFQGPEDIEITSGFGPREGSTAQNNPSATLAVHCGNGFDAGFNPYQSTPMLSPEWERICGDASSSFFSAAVRRRLGRLRRVRSSPRKSD
jgi:hypothetical protein